MTRTNRLLNRVVLALLGLTAAAAAVLLALPALAETGLPIAADVARATRFDGTLTQTQLIVGIAGAVVLIGLALAVLLTRGRGRTATAYRGDSVEFDVRVVREVLAAALAGEPDAVSVSASAYRVRRTTALRVRVDTRPGADLERLRTTLDGAIARLDETLGTPLPMLVHLTSGFRASHSREERAV